jgi:hypothetical protein
MYCPERSSSALRWVFVMRTGRWRGAPPRFPFFLFVGAFGTTVSAAVTCKPSVKVSVGNQRRGGLHEPEASCFSKSTSFGTLRECQRSLNSVDMTHESQWLPPNGQSPPFSTASPPFSSVGLISFQKTILSCPSFTVRVTSTSPSFSNSSIA